MAVIRVEKRKGYTIMSNYHLRDKNLSLKAKGLLSIMLSLPDEWHYNVRGLAAICKEGVTSISSTLKELEQWGYMRRHQPNQGGKFGEIEYIISETPQKGPSGNEAGQNDGSCFSDAPDGTESLQDGFSDASDGLLGVDYPSDGNSLPSAASLPSTASEAPGKVKSAPARKRKSAPSASNVTPIQDAQFAASEPCSDPPYTDIPYTGFPCTENPYTVIPNTGHPYAETAYTQTPNANKIKTPGKTDRKTTDQSNHPSINPGQDAGFSGQSALQPACGDGMDAIDMDDQQFLQEIGAQRLRSDYDAYRELVMENISYDVLLERFPTDGDTIRGIVDIMVDAICSTAPTIRIAGQDIPQPVVKSQLLKLKNSHIEYVMTCLGKNTIRIRNIKSYLLTTLYNAPSTMDAYFQNWVQSDYPELAQH